MPIVDFRHRQVHHGTIIFWSVNFLNELAQGNSTIPAWPHLLRIAGAKSSLGVRIYWSIELSRPGHIQQLFTAGWHGWGVAKPQLSATITIISSSPCKWQHNDAVPHEHNWRMLS